MAAATRPSNQLTRDEMDMYENLMNFYRQRGLFKLTLKPVTWIRCVQDDPANLERTCFAIIHDPGDARIVKQSLELHFYHTPFQLAFVNKKRYDNGRRTERRIREISTFAVLPKKII